jgi:hypothetical protein
LLGLIFDEFTGISALSDLSLTHEENHSRLGFANPPVSLVASSLHYWKPSEHSFV